MMAKKIGEKSAKKKETKSAAAKLAAPIKEASKVLRSRASDAMANGRTINAKVIDHAETNAKEAFAALRDAATAQSVQDVLKVQTKFIKEQSARATEQIREVGELIAGFGRDAISSLRKK